MDLEIRPMEEKDIKQVEAIEKNIFSIPWSYESFLSACNNESNIYLVAVKQNTIVGYCGMWTVLGEGNITNMAVEANSRGKGYGKALMTEMERLGEEKNIFLYFLEVRKSNLVAQKLYSDLGYNQIGIRKNFYEKPVEDAIVMSKGFGVK